MPVFVLENLSGPTTKWRCNSASAPPATMCAPRKVHRQLVWPISCVHSDYDGPDPHWLDDYGDRFNGCEHFGTLASGMPSPLQGWRPGSDGAVTVADASRTQPVSGASSLAQ